MKKIYMNDSYCMTEKFLRGEILVLMDKFIDADNKDAVAIDGRYFEFSDGERVHTRFAEGDRVAVMMSYEKAGLDPVVFGSNPGWKKKMCANPKYMPYWLVIERVRCIRAWDISEDEMLKAGVYRNSGGYCMVGGDIGGTDKDCKEMFRQLFNGRSSVMWEDNPWVIIYDVTPVIGRGTEIARR